MTKKKESPKKTKPKLSVPWQSRLLIFAISVIAIFVVIQFGKLIFKATDDFNPETDFCEQWFCEYEKPISFMDCNGEEFRIKGHFQTGECKEFDNIGSTKIKSAKCTHHRPETFYELCLDDWTNECEAECLCDEWEMINKTVFTDELECKPSFETTHDFGEIEKVEIKSVNLCGSNCTTEKYKDCGDYTCTTINLTKCIHSTWQKKAETRETKGSCTSAHPKNPFNKKKPIITVTIPGQVTLIPEGLITTSQFPINCTLRCEDNITIEVKFDVNQKYDDLYIPFEPNAERCNTTCGGIA